MDDVAFNTAQIKRLRKQIRTWYSAHQRQLPWRETRDPYRIWLSEIMLQQTTIAAVMPYYERFLLRFPDLQTLAAAEEAEVLRLWEGLGYYSRARNIHKTAQILVSERNGCFPETVAELQQLPGIGRYTAGAIVSFAYNRPAPIVEANTQRLYARLLAWEAAVSLSGSQKVLWEFAAQIVPDQEPGLFNQAVMDLGSRVCTPVDPTCETCPVRDCCRSFATGKQHEIPVQPRKQPPTQQVHVCLVIERSKRILLHQYRPGERWAGLHDFPRWETTLLADTHPLLQARHKQKPPAGQRQLFSPSETAETLPPAIEQEFAERYGETIQLTGHLATIRHTVTRYAITLVVFSATTSSRFLPTSLNQPEWISRADLHDRPLSTTGRKIADLLG